MGYTANSAEYLNTLFHAYLEREVARCASIRELLKYHDDLCTSIDNIRVNVERLQSKKAQTEKILWQIKDSKADMEEKIFLMNTFYKGFFYFTLPLSVKNRSETFRKMSENVAAYELIEGTCQQQSAARLLSSLNSSAIKAITDTRTMLDLLALCPLSTIDHEEDVLSEISILPGMSLKPCKDWIVSLYESYSNEREDDQVLVKDPESGADTNADTATEEITLSLDISSVTVEEKVETSPSMNPVTSNHQLDMLTSTQSEEKKDADKVDMFGP